MIAKIDKVTNMIEQPDIWLCHRNHDKICLLPFIDDLKIYVTANAVDEVSFSVHKHNNGVEFEYWEQIENLKVVCVDGFGYFEIAVDKQVSDDTKKVITGISTEAELGQIKVYGLEVNGEIDRKDDSNWDSSGNCIPTVIYNSSDTQHSLLHRLLSFAPHWKLGDVNNTCPTITVNDEEKSVSIEHRTFNFDDISVYDALQEIATELDVVFLFNTVERTINMYNLNTIGEDTTIYVSTENLATDFTCTSNKDSIKNCFKIVGGDENINVAIRAVNPNGSDYIYYFSPEQMEDMSEGLRTKLTKYEEYSESLKSEYNECCNDLYNAIDDYYNLKTSMMPNKAPDEETDIDKEIAKLTSSKIGNIPVQSLTTLYQTGAEKAILTIAQVMVDYRYEVTINSGLYDTTTHTWTGKFKVTNTSNSSDAAVSANDVVLTFVEDEKEYLQDKINELVKDVSVEDVNIEKFKENLTYYALDSLEQFVSIYAECTKELEKYSYKDKVEEEFYELYHSYWEKWQACISERDTRKTQVATAEKNVEKYQEHVDTYHEMLDFEHFMGDYYKEFCLYRREDTYQNDNYISDGLDNSNTLQNAKKLVEVATKELIKASLFQTTYTANLNNLFTNPIYKPFYEHFDLFNWIHAEIDGKQIMLRLIGITFDFSSIEKIEVEFSEQVRNANGITDLQSILGQAKSMATSYSSTVKQAASGQEACLEFDTIKQEGLNSALMNIKNSNNEEVVIDNCGINCRSKDQNDQYDQCQLRITGKNIVMTDDDWRTARLAIGKIFVNYDSDGDGIKEPHEEYGIVADCIIGEMIIGETLLVANSSGTFLVDKDGIIVKNMKLDMSNADGSRRIVIDPELDSILSVYTNSKQVFYVDINGNMCMLGNLYVNNNNMYLKVDMTAENIIEVGYGEIAGTGNEGEAGSGEGGGVNTGNYVEQMWEQVDYGQDIYNGATPIIASGISSNIDTFNNATLFTQYHFLNYSGEIYHLAYGKYLVKYNEKQQTWNLVVQISNDRAGNVRYSSFVKTNKEDGNIYIFYTGVPGNYGSGGCLYKYNIESSSLSEVWAAGEIALQVDGYFDYGRHYIKDDTLYIASHSAWDIDAPLKVVLNSDRTYKSSGHVKWCDGNNRIHEIIPYNNEEYGVISIGQSKVILVKFKNIDSFTYNTLYTFDYTMSSNLRTGGIIADVFNDKIYIVFKNMSIHYEYDIKSGKMNELKTFKLSLYGTAENPKSTDGAVGVTGFSMIASSDKLHMFALGANQCYGSDIYTGRYSSGYSLKDLLHIPQYYIRHYEYLDDGKIETNKKFQKLTSGYNFYMSRQCSFTKIGDIIYNIPTFWGMLTGDTTSNSKTANYSTWNMPIYALDTTSTDNDFQIICNSIGVPIISVINSNSTSKIYFFAGTDATYLQYYDLDTQTVGSVFTDESGNKVACGLGWHEFSYIDENEQILYEMGTYFTKWDLTTNSMLQQVSLGLYVHSNVEVINDEFHFVSLMSDRSKTKLYKLTKSGELSTLATMQESEDIGNNMAYSIAYYNNKIHMYYSVNGVLKRKRYEYSFETGEVTSYTDMFQDNGMYIYDNGLGSNCTCHLPAIATSTGIHYFTGTTYDFNNKFTNPFNHYLYTESTNENTNKETEWAIGTFDETPNRLSDVCYYNGKFIASGQADYNDCLWTSDDLLSWSKIENTSAGTQLCSNDNIIVAAGTYFYYSTDSVSWFKSDTQPSMSPIKKLIYANNMFVACGVFEGLYYSTDGIIWNEVSISNCTCGSNSQFDNLFYIDGKFIAVGYAPPTYSTDGITWFHYDTYDIPVDTDTIQYCNGHLVGYKFGENNVIEVYEGSNSDVVSWTLLSSIPTNFNGYTSSRICYANEKYTIVIPSGDNKEPCIIFSEDLLNWTTQEQFLGETASCSYTQLVYLDNANKLIFLGRYDTLLYSLDCSTTPVIPDVVNPDEDGKIFYITNTGDGYFYGNVYAKDGIFKGDIIAKSLTLGEGVTLNTSDISGMDDYVLTDVGLGTESGTYCKIGKDGLLTAKNAIISGQANIGEGYIGGWEIGDNGLKSVGFDDTSITNGIRLDKSGEIRSKGSWYSSVDGSGVEGWFSRLCSGKWIFGYYDSTQSDPFVPPTGTPYSDISVNGIYMCSKDTILNKSSQYLFAVDTTNDTVSITNSSSNSPALTITNNYFSNDNSYDAPALVLHSPKQGYRNRPLDVRMRVTGEIMGTGQTVDNEYCMQMFGEQEYGRIIFRSSKIVDSSPEGNTADTESSDPLVPSMIGSSTFRWFQGYFMELYSTNGLNTSSDKKIKNHIQDIDANKSLELINSLTPVEYTLKNNANNRKHMGFYAQDVKKTCDDMELGNMSLYAATWHKDGQEQECYYSEDAPDEELSWTLKYEEFIAPLVGAVQALTKRVEDLEADNEKLRTRIEKLEDASE